MNSPILSSSPTPNTSSPKWQPAQFKQTFRSSPMMVHELIYFERELDRYQRRISIAKSMIRRIRYGKKIRTLQARLTYLRIENS